MNREKIINLVLVGVAVVAAFIILWLVFKPDKTPVVEVQDPNLGARTAETFSLTALASDLLPSADNTYDLGSASYSWADAHIQGTAYIGSVNATNGLFLTALSVPSSTNPTVSQASSLVINTNSSTLEFWNGTAARTVGDVSYRTITIPSSTLDAYQGQTNSSTIPLGIASARGEQVTAIGCYMDSGTGDFEFGDGGSWMETQRVSQSLVVDTTLTNNTFTEYEPRFIRLGQFSTTGTMSCTIVIRELTN